MPDICLYCQVHQPYRLRRYRFFDIGTDTDYFDVEANRSILRKVAAKCYLPANQLLLRMIEDSSGTFRLALSITGTVLEQLADAAPETLESFQRLVATGAVELLGETYYHSLASLADRDEFEQQVVLHRMTIHKWFGKWPTVFRNTELIYSDDLASVVSGLGFQGVLVEGAERALGWRLPNFVYEAATAPGLVVIPRNYQLSDDVGFRFSNRNWHGWPLTADRYASWIASSPGDSVHLFVDYETFGEHQWADTGIFEFLGHLPAECARRGISFVHPRDLAKRQPVDKLAFPTPTSWADTERDVTAWLGNGLQHAAQQRLYALRDRVLLSGDRRTIERWRRLTTSDHLYYMCTKWFSDGDVHKYFSPYDTPYDAFIAFMNVVEDLEQALAPQLVEQPPHLAWPGYGEMACMA